MPDKLPPHTRVHVPSVVAFKGNGREPPTPGFVITFDGDADMAPKHGWLIKHVAPAQGVGLLAGQSGVGKTYLTFDLALATILGTEFAGHNVEHQGGVLLFAAEGSTLVRSRWEAVKKSKAAPFFAQQGEQLPKLPFGWITDVPVLTADNALIEYTRACRQMQDKLKTTYETGLSLVIVDTLMASAMFRDPNDAGEAQKTMNVLGKLAQEVDTTVLAVDHFGKNVDLGVRGSSAKEAAADFVLAVFGEKTNAGIASNLELVVRKMRGGASGLRASFNLAEVGMGTDEHGDAVSDLVVHWHQGATPKRRAANNRRYAALITTMDEALDSHGRMRAPAAGWPVVKVVEDRFVRTAFAVRYPPTGDEKTRAEAISKAYRRAMKDSIENKMICSYAPENGEVLVWKLEVDSNGHHTNGSLSVQWSGGAGQHTPVSQDTGVLSAPDEDFELEF